MRVVVSGANGMVGSALAPLLAARGDSMRRLVRESGTDADATWNPGKGELEPRVFEGVDAVVHLAGESIGEGRWTAAKKQRIRDSRSHGTRLLATALARAKVRPRVLVSASAVGFYGDRGDALLDESAPLGPGFLADVCREWEEATRPAFDAGVRVVNARFGFVLSPKGGGLKKMLPPFRFGLGGPIGDGKQYMSWVALDDVAAAIAHALTNETLRGAVNVVAPNPATNREFTKALGRVLGRPTVLPMPGFAARAVFGEMGEELLLSSQRVAPKKLLASGFAFSWPTLEEALRHVLAEVPAAAPAAAHAEGSHAS
jgi:uncharacterized protein (TIGR01777 family)